MKKRNHTSDKVKPFASLNSKFPGGLMRMSAVAVYTLHELESLRRVGALEGHDVTTPLGWMLYQELQAIGFRPTRDESRRATATLMMGGNYQMSLLKELEKKRCLPTTAKIFQEQFARVADKYPDAEIEVNGLQMSQGSYVIYSDNKIQVFVIPLQ